MLRYQLNPHFLFNTLNSISTLVLLQQTERANAMLSRLSSFLRYTLVNEPTAKVTLVQEVETLKLYLEIEKMRFEDRLRPHFKIDGDTIGARIPSLLLQPLIENAIKYAVTPAEHGADIWITAQREGRAVRIEVADSGPGPGGDSDRCPVDRRRPGEHPGPFGAGLWSGTWLFYPNERTWGLQRYHRNSARNRSKGSFMTIRTILVDDEPLATQGLRLRLEAHEDVEIVATAANGREAIRAIKTHKPDLVFLDIQMPGFDGFSVISGMMEVEPPLFVFVTAYNEHALRAFEAQAVDYLMKPVEEDRLAATLDRVRQRLAEKRGAEEVKQLKEALAEHAPEAAEELADAMPDAPAANRFEKMINIRDQGQIFRVDVDTIERIDAAGDYMCIQTGDNTLILRETMKDLEKRLDPRRFQRVHRSTIVNLDLVRQVKPHTNGECFLVLDSGHR